MTTIQIRTPLDGIACYIIQEGRDIRHGKVQREIKKIDTYLLHYSSHETGNKKCIYILHKGEAESLILAFCIVHTCNRIHGNEEFKGHLEGDSSFLHYSLIIHGDNEYNRHVY